MDFRDLYKNRRIPTLSNTVAKHYQDIITCRQEKQREFFWSKRGQTEIAALRKNEVLEKKKKTRVELLMKWKEEKLRKQEEEKKKCKPIFKVGAVQKKVTGSPVIVEKNFRQNLKKKDEKIAKPQTAINEKCEGIMTRSKTKLKTNSKEIESKNKKQFNATKKKEGESKTYKLGNKFCKIEIGKIKKVNSLAFKVPDQVAALPYSNKLTFPNSPNITKKKTAFFIKSEIDSVIKHNSDKSPKVHTSSITHVENKNDNFKIIQSFSEIQKSSKFEKSGYNVYKNKCESEISKEENEFQHRIFLFREYIEDKSKMLLEKCDKWKNISKDFEGPSEIQGDIDSVIGKTKLLTSDKFLQFKNLIDKCEKRDPLIKLDDLEGFKDWVSIEVENIYQDFEKLEKQKNNNWIVENLCVENNKKQKKKNCTNKKSVIKSNIRSHIQAARKVLQSENKHFNFELNEIKIEQENKPTMKIFNEKSSPETKIFFKSDELSAVTTGKRNSNLKTNCSTPTNKIGHTKNDSLILKKSDLMYNIKGQTNFSQGYQKSGGKKKTRCFNTLKCNVLSNYDSENISKGLSEKYFRHPENDEKTPVRSVLGEMNVNVTTPARITTRSTYNYQNLE